MPQSQLSRLSTALAVIFLALSAEQVTGGQLDSLKYLLEGYKPIVGRRVQLRGRFEGFNAEDGKLPSKPTGYYNFSTESVLGSDTWTRVKCTPYAMGVTGKNGEYSVRDVEFILDSNKWYTLTGAIHQDGKKIEIQRCDISKTRPVWIGGENQDGIDCGLAALLPDLRVIQGRSLSSLIEKPELPFNYDVSTRLENGLMVTVLSSLTFSHELHCTADSTGNAPALVKMIFRRNLGAEDSEKVDIEYAFTPADPVETARSGVPYFRRIERSVKLGGVLQDLSTIAIDSVEVLAREPLHQDVVLAPGWIVQDETLGIGYVTAPNDEQMLKSIRQLLNK